jgi:hypothetical protein
MRAPVLFLLALVGATSAAASGGASDGAATPACPSPALTSSLFAALNLSIPALSSVAAAHARGDIEVACALLSAYYAGAETASSLRLPAAPAPGTGVAGGDADAALKDIYSFYGETSRVPRNVSCEGRPGGLDWEFSGPIHDEEYHASVHPCISSATVSRMTMLKN